MSTAAAASAGSGGDSAVPCGDVARLIQEIERANARGSGVIRLGGSGADTHRDDSPCVYTLTQPAAPSGANGLPVITGNVAVIAQGATITRSAAAPPFRIAEIAPGGTLHLTAVTVSNGSATAGTTDVGGGILDGGRLVMRNSRVIGNRASRIGGGIEVASGAGAWLFNNTVSYNKSRDGGGIHANDSARLVMKGGSVFRNTAQSTGGGISSFGTADLHSVSIHDNWAVELGGGGIFTSTGPMTLTGGSVRDNRAAYGGGIANFGSTLKLRGTSVSGNIANENGGGLYLHAGTSRLAKSRVTDNAAHGEGGGGGGGIFRNAGGTLALTDTVVRGNLPDDCVPSCSGS
jgi:hypothetical protein